MHQNGTTAIDSWPEEARAAAQLVIERYGEPHEVTDSYLVWNRVGPWKRIVASKAFWQHDFPAPHFDSIESVLDYHVPTEMFTQLAEFDGSIVVERTAGEVSVRCHDEETNRLALNLMNDIVAGEKTVDEARDYYAQEFLDHRRKKPTPYMDELRFELEDDTADPDERFLSDEELERAEREGAKAEQAA